MPIWLPTKAFRLNAKPRVAAAIDSSRNSGIQLIFLIPVLNSSSEMLRSPHVNHVSLTVQEILGNHQFGFMVNSISTIVVISNNITKHCYS